MQVEVLQKKNTFIAHLFVCLISIQIVLDIFSTISNWDVGKSESKLSQCILTHYSILMIHPLVSLYDWLRLLFVTHNNNSANNEIQTKSQKLLNLKS